MRKRYDIIVVGGGHAGIEASLAAARLGCQVLLVTHDPDEIGRMPCNPAIGGLGKGHLVREIDALGGQMARTIDQTGIQFRILNRRKGPAVQAPRAQADKRAYQQAMQWQILGQKNLDVLKDDAAELITEPASHCGRQAGHARIMGLRTAAKDEIVCPRVILCTGTFLRGLMHVGERRCKGGREGAASAEGLSGELRRLGFSLRRLKTGTPPRLHRDSIDTSALSAQPGDDPPRPFSFRTQNFQPKQILCHLAHTNEDTHALIRRNLHRSPLYAGTIKGRGPRYCPSIEDKVVRFEDRSRHLLFLEPEGIHSEEVYINGLSTSLPADIQEAVVHSIEGLQEARIVRYGYAVEYDSVPSYQVQKTLESKLVDGLYLAGQIIGTSGYEEAAAQGLMAGLNAALDTLHQPELILDRSEAYIGVLVDDLVTKEISEPYRMFTSRAEYRLSLRCDNAESRLLSHAERLGLLPAEDLQKMSERARWVETVGVQLDQYELMDSKDGERLSAAEWMRRPEANMNALFHELHGGDALLSSIRAEVGPGGAHESEERMLEAVLAEVECNIKYAGYIHRQARLLSRQRHLDDLEMPADLNYQRIDALSLEAREKLQRMRPATLGQASRIDGVRAGDLAVLSVLMKRRGSREGGGQAESEAPGP